MKLKDRYEKVLQMAISYMYSNLDDVNEAFCLEDENAITEEELDIFISNHTISEELSKIERQFNVGKNFAEGMCKRGKT